jgi:hypothetical protein
MHRGPHPLGADRELARWHPTKYFALRSETRAMGLQLFLRPDDPVPDASRTPGTFTDPRGVKHTRKAVRRLGLDIVSQKTICTLPNSALPIPLQSSNIFC